MAQRHLEKFCSSRQMNNLHTFTLTTEHFDTILNRDEDNIFGQQSKLVIRCTVKYIQYTYENRYVKLAFVAAAVSPQVKGN